MKITSCHLVALEDDTRLIRINSNHWIEQIASDEWALSTHGTDILEAEFQAKEIA